MVGTNGKSAMNTKAGLIEAMALFYNMSGCDKLES